MRNKKLSGMAFSEYLIIIVLISLALTPILVVFGGNIYSQLQSLLNTFSENNSIISKNISATSSSSSSTTTTSSPSASNAKGGALGGTEDEPVSKCEKGVCDIDFGSFMLTGIPDNFTEYTKANGTSGGSNLIANLFLQIADQLEKEGDTAGAEDYRKLANLGHYIGTTQKQAEDIINSQSSGTTVNLSKVYDLLGKEKCTTPISDIASLFPESAGTTVKYAVLTNISNARNSEKFPASNTESLSDSYAPYAFNTLYDKIMSDSKYSANIKSVTEMLYRKMDSVGIGLSSAVRAINLSTASTTLKLYDPVTGEELSDSIVTPAPDADGNLPTALFLDPSSSIGSNLDAALICVTGKNKDTGTNCNKK